MNFNWVAEDYCQNSLFQYSHAREVISKHIFKGDENVLDVGCGDGKITAYISDKVKNGAVIGIDSSEPMIKFANLKFSKRNTNLSFKIGKAESIKYKHKFDLIFSFACLHWVKDQLSFLNGAKRALKNNGKIILTLYPKHQLIWDAIKETISEPIWNDYFLGYENPHISYDKEIYKTISETAELNILHLEENAPIAYFKKKTDMEDFLRSWLPHTDQIHPHLREKFIISIGENFLNKISVNQNGIIAMPFRRLDAILSKN